MASFLMDIFTFRHLLLITRISSLYKIDFQLLKHFRLNVFGTLKYETFSF